MIFEFTAPGTPQQNSVVERKIPTLVGRARAMLIQVCRIFGAYRLEFSSSIPQLVGLGGLFCQLNVTEQESLVTTI